MTQVFTNAAQMTAQMLITVNHKQKCNMPAESDPARNVDNRVCTHRNMPLILSAWLTSPAIDSCAISFWMATVLKA